MFQDNEYIGFVTYTQGKRNRKIPFGIVSQSYKQKAIVTHYSRKIRKNLIAIEDKRYFSHLGIDIKSISRALYMNIKARRIIQGGSTITQQLARNLFEDHSITFHRKIKEILYAISLEREHTKEEILDLYFNNIYWGKNLYGIRAASLYYFAKEPYLLSQQEQLLLLTILRGPNYYIRHSDLCMKRYNLLNEILFKKGIISKNVYQNNKMWTYNFEYNKLSIIPPSVIPYITKSINNKKSSILTSLNFDLQNFINYTIEKSPYPISIVVLQDGKIIGINSKYGIDYPLTFHSNIGSTLKPFLYTFYRENGVSKEETFNCITTINNQKWNVKEAELPSKSVLNIQEALLTSNNNAFINAANKIGMNNVLKFIASLLNKEESNIHPSSILGATSNGISLFELTKLYADFFLNNDDPFKNECKQLLCQIAKIKLGIDINNLFLKTGTTNGNKERFAILGNEKIVLGIMRQENSINDYSKDGSFINSIKNIARNIFSPPKNVHMDVINNFISENKDILSILITLLVGFIAWICKELIETPMRQSRETFFKVTEKRIGILSELYNYINIIALFPQETNIKEELQKIILSDKLAYVDEKIIVDIIEIAFKEVTNERLVLDTRKELRETIDKCAEIIRKENQYFLKHDTTNTYKRVIAYFIQLIKAISFIVFILIAIFYLIKGIVFLSVVWIIFCCIFIFAVMLILEKYII